MVTDKSGPIGVTGTPRRDLIIGAGAFVCLAKILRATVRAHAAEADGSADSRIVSGSESIVPVSVEAGEVIVDVSINGRGPFPLIFDTGAEDAVTPEIAAALGLKTEGTGTVRDSGGGSLSIAFTRVAGVRVGDAEMTDQRFAVLPLPGHVTDRGNRPPIAGFIGYELLTLRGPSRLRRRDIDAEAGNGFSIQREGRTRSFHPRRQYGGGAWSGRRDRGQVRGRYRIDRSADLAARVRRGSWPQRPSSLGTAD
jgi:hypothetical protein